MLGYASLPRLRGLFLGDEARSDGRQRLAAAQVRLSAFCRPRIRIRLSCVRLTGSQGTTARETQSSKPKQSSSWGLGEDERPSQCGLATCRIVGKKRAVATDDAEGTQPPPNRHYLCG
jgi:hypothetical protein